MNGAGLPAWRYCNLSKNLLLETRVKSFLGQGMKKLLIGIFLFVEMVSPIPVCSQETNLQEADTVQNNEEDAAVVSEPAAEETPGEYPSLDEDKKENLHERLDYLRENDPKAYRKAVAHLRQRRKGYLTWLRRNRPQVYKKLIRHRRSGARRRLTIFKRKKALHRKRALRDREMQRLRRSNPAAYRRLHLGRRRIPSDWRGFQGGYPRRRRENLLETWLDKAWTRSEDRKNQRDEIWRRRWDWWDRWLEERSHKARQEPGDFEPESRVRYNRPLIKQ